MAEPCITFLFIKLKGTKFNLFYPSFIRKWAAYLDALQNWKLCVRFSVCTCVHMYVCVCVRFFFFRTLSTDEMVYCVVVLLFGSFPICFFPSHAVIFMYVMWNTEMAQTPWSVDTVRGHLPDIRIDEFYIEGWPRIWGIDCTKLAILWAINIPF